jgi:uncharacterized RDD family membrane protein YckC
MNQQYVGFGTRFVAALIDGLLLIAVGIVLGMVFGAAGQDPQNFSMQQGLSLVINLLYFVYYQGKTGQTLGKKAMKIKVVDAEGKKPSYMTFFLREFIGKTISALVLFIGYLMILWDKNKQGLHDKIASTYVVRA